MCSSKYLSKKRWVCCGAGHATDKSIRFCVPGKTRNCKTFEKSCDSCNRIQNVFVSARSIFTVFSWAYQLSIQHLHEHWTWLNGQLISPLYIFSLTLNSRCVERLMVISSNYAPAVISAASINLMKVTQKLMGELMTQLSSNHSTLDQFET